jgi:glycosyltransferase involved in cell wall biosynthesis
MRRLSIVIPAYNEEAFIGTLLEKLLALDLSSCEFTTEIVVVDDGSKDRTSEIAARYPVKLITQPNQGKGRAVQRGIQEATGEFVIVQDADLEYDPEDYKPMLAEINRGASSVYGSRVLGQLRKNGWSLTPGRHPEQSLGPWLAGVVLSCWTAVLYFKWISDTLTAYKIYPRNVFNTMQVKTYGFETDHEITAKLIRRGIGIREVPISYQPRSAEEGKKIRAVDGLIAVWTLLRFRYES